ncbi:MAG: VOC family protein [Candidatus Eremiobacteraeota bacterium]|nr:VOC family protein [Candidatus Eremiobacteraeota bacterium]
MSTTPQTAVNGATIIGIDLAAYLTGDPQRSIAFYRDVLGMNPTELDDEGRGAEFTLPDGTTFGIWKPDSGNASGGTMMFAVGNIDEAVKAIRERGGALSDPMESPVCHMSFGQDPDGNGFIIHQRKVRD